MKTVQVTSDAKASPIITAFTMMSADMNITQGDNSFMAGAMPAFGGSVGCRGHGSLGRRARAAARSAREPLALAPQQREQPDG